MLSNLNLTFPFLFYFSDKAREYVRIRVLKLNTKEDYRLRVKEIEKYVTNNPTHLHINIFDEAHHSATSKDDAGGEFGSAYEIFANSWNSDDHENVINLLVSFLYLFLSTPVFSTMNFSTLGLRSSWLKSLGLKLGVEKSGVEMSFNRSQLVHH